MCPMSLAQGAMKHVKLVYVYRWCFCGTAQERVHVGQMSWSEESADTLACMLLSETSEECPGHPGKYNYLLPSYSCH